MDSARRYGRSWIFQKGSNGGGGGHTDPVISRGDSLSVFVSVDLKNRDCEVLGPFDMSDLRPLMYICTCIILVLDCMYEDSSRKLLYSLFIYL